MSQDNWNTERRELDAHLEKMSQDNWDTERRELDEHLDDWSSIGLVPSTELGLVADRLDQIKNLPDMISPLELEQLASHLRTIAQLVNKQTMESIQLAKGVLELIDSLVLED